MNKEAQVIMAIKDLYDKIGWLNRLKLAEAFKNDHFQYNSSEISCIEYIGNNVDANEMNVTKLAESFYMTRSALSKLTKKLMNKGIIESYQKPGNKKEIYFRLTELGKKIYHIHEEMTKKFLDRDKVVFEQVPEEEIDSILHFFEQYKKHLDDEIEKMNVDK